MNTILQKRIEDAANMTVQNLYDYAKQTRNPKVSAYSEGYLDAIDVQGDFLFREGANYALSNQWISVEEALPPLTQESGQVYLTVDKNGYVDVKARNLDGWSSSRGWCSTERITHWMCIPSLEGGEK